MIHLTGTFYVLADSPNTEHCSTGDELPSYWAVARSVIIGNPKLFPTMAANTNTGAP
ncbi:hypothetical protein PCASD_23107 [Puccinia coronata f. sp. avenae]|uniref:Uncharacterized protein n=1 Tax=Puccinia coronata f. sp. avenae TaxID=200324 RepID=A0A2N5S6H3_9BASI|nr:hypothetical protein PCASD_23107 [Puccinia coronata f. sp. avenae]